MSAGRRRMIFPLWIVRQNVGQDLDGDFAIEFRAARSINPMPSTGAGLPDDAVVAQCLADHGEGCRPWQAS